MRYDRKRADAVSMLMQNMLHLMPVYWLAMVATVPLDYIPAWYNSDMSHLQVVVAFLSNAFLLNGFVHPSGKVMPCIAPYGIILGQTYYLRGQFFFTLCFNY